MYFRSASRLPVGVIRHVRPGGMRRFWRGVLAITAFLAVMFVALTARLFVWPATGGQGQVDAILMTASPYAPLGLATRLAQADGAKYLLVSLGHDGYGGSCPQRIPRTRLICFDPNPATTQGEAEYASRIAAKHNWRSILVVSIVPQEWRAEQRLRRCFTGTIYGIAGGIPWYSWPYEIAYEWGATIKMFVWQRSC